MRTLAALLVLTACSATDPQPAVRTYGILQPLCILLCEAAVETVDSVGGEASGATITQSEGTIK